MTTRDVHRHPLFWVPGEEFQRADEWSFPKSFSFGDMDILEEHNLSDISDNYFRCAEVLIERIFDNQLEDFVAQFPIIYLFRHAFEVKLKQIIDVQTGEKVANEHSLHALANKIGGLEGWALKRIQELNEIDPRSTRLRYGGVGSNAKDYLGTDVRFFRAAMCELRDYLKAFAAESRVRTAS